MFMPVDGMSLFRRIYEGMTQGTSPGSERIGPIARAGVRALTDAAQVLQPQYMLVAFDAEGATWRHEIYDQYKASRSRPPEFQEVVGRIQEWLTLCGVAWVERPRYEADDIIASAVTRWQALRPDEPVVVVTRDKDLMQLVSAQVQIWDHRTGETVNVTAVVEKFGIEPHQISDYLALIGDGSDDIPGAKGVGAKTATPLLKEYGTVTNLLSSTDELPGKRGQLISKNRAAIELSAQLTQLCHNMAFDLSLRDLRVPPGFSGLAYDEGA